MKEATGICQRPGCKNQAQHSKCSKDKWLKFCSVSCRASHVCEVRKKTWIAKYGVDNPARTALVRKKISEGMVAYNKSIGKEPIRKRSFAFQPPTQRQSIGTGFYVYVLLDPRKPGAFQYGRWRFDYEPFYVGKGKGGRAYSHTRSCDISGDGIDRNSFKQNKIKSIMRETGQNPSICIKRKDLAEQEAFVIEAKLIWSIGRKDLKLGPLANHSDGGEGISGQKWTKKQKAEQSIRIKKYFDTLTDEQKRQRSIKRSINQRPQRRLLGKETLYQKELDIVYKGKVIHLHVGPIRQDAKIKHKCTTCKHIWLSSPRDMKSSALGCPECRSVDPKILEHKRMNRSKAQSIVQKNLTAADKAKIAKKISIAVSESWSYGKLSERRA